MSSSYRLELNNWLADLDISAEYVFDVGGSQEPLKKRVKSFDVDNYLIFDLDKPHADSPQPDVVLDLNKPFNKNIAGYLGLGDYVFCLEVFDYIYRPDTALKVLKELTKPGGTLWVSFPSIYPLHQPIEDDALRYMPGGINKLADFVGLTVKQMIPRRFETIAFDNLWRAERMRAAKHQDHNFSGWIVEFTR